MITLYHGSNVEIALSKCYNYKMLRHEMKYGKIV